MCLNFGGAGAIGQHCLAGVFCDNASGRAENAGNGPHFPVSNFNGLKKISQFNCRQKNACLFRTFLDPNMAPQTKSGIPRTNYQRNKK
jgi:hypothetical protein